MNLDTNSQSLISIVLTGKGQGSATPFTYTLPKSGSDLDIPKGSRRGDLKPQKQRCRKNHLDSFLIFQL